MQTYGSIIPRGPTLAWRLPRSGGEAHPPPSLAREARKRLAAVRWYEDHGQNASLTARHFGLSRSTLYVWLGRYKESGARGLEDRRRQPRRVRRPTWDGDLETGVP
jgi:hypothetical protein